MNIAETLATELVRVAGVRATYEELRRQGSGLSVAPVLTMIDAAINRGIKAAGSNEALQVLDSIKELQGYCS